MKHHHVVTPQPLPRTPPLDGRSRYHRHKRLLDLVCAVGLGVVALPIMIVAALAIALTLGRPILFRQSRPGLHGRPFTLLKFRTMRLPDPARGQVSDGDRLTRLGRLLRTTSVDELPSLWNVIRGEMSLVGPRPLLMDYLDRYTPEQARRHAVPPGITGLAQVRGRNALTWEQKFAYDVWYVENRSLRLDLRILAETVTTVLRRADTSAAGSPTAHEFRGTGARCSGTRVHDHQGWPPMSDVGTLEPERSLR